MFPSTEGEPLELVVMSDVPACVDGAAVGVEQVGFRTPGVDLSSSTLSLADSQVDKTILEQRKQ